MCPRITMKKILTVTSEIHQASENKHKWGKPNHNVVNTPSIPEESQSGKNKYNVVSNKESLTLMSEKLGNPNRNVGNKSIMTLKYKWESNNILQQKPVMIITLPKIYSTRHTPMSARRLIINRHLLVCGDNRWWWSPYQKYTQVNSS